MPDPVPLRKGALLVTRNLPPLRGGMERLGQHLACSLDAVFDLAVVGPTGCRARLPDTVAVAEVPHRSLPRFLCAAAIAAWRGAGQRRPHVVLAGSGLTAPMAWLAAKRAKARFVVYLHGLDIIAPHPLYQWCWLPFLRRADRVLVNSHNTRRLAIAHGIDAATIDVLHPGTELPEPDAMAGASFRAANGLGDRPLLLSVGRLTPRKGLAEFVRDALPAILDRHPDAVLLVIGGDALDAVHVAGGSQRACIQRSAEAAGIAEAVRLLGPCDDATLSAAYRAADAYVFPVLDVPGDVEGFGMVAIEAAAHGLPTIGFDVGGVADAIIPDVTGSLVQAGDHAAFAAQVDRWVTRRQDPLIAERCATAARAFGWDVFTERLHALLADGPSS